MKLNAIHHIAIIVSDIEAAKEFYVQKLGFEIIRENYRDERKDWKLDLKIGEGAEAIELEIFAEPNPHDVLLDRKPAVCVIWRSGWRTLWRLLTN